MLEEKHICKKKSICENTGDFSLHIKVTFMDVKAASKIIDFETRVLCALFSPNDLSKSCVSSGTTVS